VTCKIIPWRYQDDREDPENTQNNRFRQNLGSDTEMGHRSVYLSQKETLYLEGLCMKFLYNPKDTKSHTHKKESKKFKAIFVYLKSYVGNTETYVM